MASIKMLFGMVVVIDAEAAAHDAVFGHFAGQQDLDDVVELHAFLLQCVPELSAWTMLREAVVRSQPPRPCP
jgi:hypothetical protein